MNNQPEKRSEQPQVQQQPGDLNSFNNRDIERSAEAEKAKEKKNEQESYQDYNGNSEVNAPARARE